MRRTLLALLLAMGMVLGFGSAAMRLACGGYPQGPHACAHVDGPPWGPHNRSNRVHSPPEP
jgi:hypothetical protein